MKIKQVTGSELIGDKIDVVSYVSFAMEMSNDVKLDGTLRK